MKRKLRMIGLSALSMLLCAVMLFNLVACTVPTKDVQTGTGEGTDGTLGTVIQTDASTLIDPSQTESTPESRVEEDLDIPPVVEVVDENPVEVKPVQKQPLVGVTAQKPQNVSAATLIGYGVTVKADAEVGLSSYASNALSVVYDTNADDNGVTDTVTVNDVISLERGYYTLGGEDELALGTVYAEFYEVEIDYTADGRVAGLYYYDRYYTYHYDQAGRITEIFRDGSLCRSFTYNARGNLVKETGVGFENTYSFSTFFKKYQGVSPTEYRKQ